MAIYSKLGREVVITKRHGNMTIYRGKKALHGLMLVSVRIAGGDGSVEGFRFAESLKATNGSQEIYEAAEAHWVPYVHLDGDELRAAIKEALS